MSHTLTQPEEINYILKAMEGNGRDGDTPISDGAYSSEAIPEIECDEFAVITDFPYGVAYKKSKC